MPAIYSHFLILEQICTRYKLSPQARQILAERAHQPYAYWGSMGPDYLFFYPPDWQGPLAMFFKVFFEFDKITSEVISVYNSASEMFGAPTDRLADIVSGGAYKEFTAVVEAMVTTVANKLAETVTNNVDFFDLIKPPMHTEQTDRKDWWWMDIGHHCRTMDYARNLWKESEGKPELRAYAYGYLSHIGGDVIGHGYVNALCGGPYRNHWRRHALVEKCLDTFLYDYTRPGKSLSSSGEYKRIHFENDPFEFPRFPDHLADYIAHCLALTYQGVGVKTPIPSAKDVKLMYDYFYRWTKASSSKSLLNLPPPPDFDWWDLPEELQERLNEATKPPPVHRPPIRDLDNVKEWKAFFKSVFRFIDWAKDAATILVGLPVYAVTHVTSTGLRYLLWLLLKVVYELYDSIRLALVMGGYAYPEKHHLDRYFQGIISPDVNTILEVYPFKRVFNSEQTYHLLHPFYQPPIDLEKTTTHPFFKDAFKPATAFLGERNVNSLAAFDTVCDFVRGSGYLDLGPKTSCTDFGYMLFGLFETGQAKNLPNWNLDVDRGFGWPQWLAVQAQPWNNINNFNFETCP